MSSVDSTVPLGGVRPHAAPLKLPLVDPDHYVDRVELREGGMGRIVTAVDRRLGRRVAIKELRLQVAALRKRFEAEALITSRLEHPSIVSVHEAGVWPSGEPFYAMKLVAGRPLDEVVGVAARLDARLALVPHVLAVADALAYAHRLRVIHRDLKPQNVLVGEFGETVVIDWGLVKDLGEGATDDAGEGAAPPEGGGSATTAGEVLGTPGYMPPEQAVGRSVDERADVYAIGALLYFVLAGERPYRHARSGHAVLEAVRRGPPEPLRELAPGVPPDLHAIVERAMARDPADRYPTARELAEDLRRFQSGQLVAAHRYSRRQLLARWLRRHRIAVTVGAIAAAVLLVAGVAALRRIVHSQEDAEAARGAAEVHRADAEDLMQFMLGDLQDRLEPIGKLELLDAVAAKVGAYYERHPTASGPDDLHRRVLARLNLGRLLQDRGDQDGALREYRVAYELALALQAMEPGSPRGLADATRTELSIANALAFRGDHAAALEAYRRAVTLGARLVVLAPTPDHERELASAHGGTGSALEALDDLGGALVELRASRSILERLAAADPEAHRFRQDLSGVSERIGRVLAAQGDTAGALAEHRAGYRILERLAAEEPDRPAIQVDLWMSGIRIADLTASEDLPEALAQRRASLAIAARLASRDPSNATWQRNLAATHQVIANTLIDLGQLDAALAETEAARKLLEQLVAKQPSSTTWKQILARNSSTRARVRLERGELDAALADLRSALAVEEAAVAETPRDPQRRLAPARTQSMISSVLHRKGDLAAAVAALREAIAITEPVAAQQPRNVEWQHELLVYSGTLGGLLLEARDPAGALAAYRRSNAAAAHLAAITGARDWRHDLGYSHELVGNALLAAGDAAGAAAEYRKGLAIAQELAAQGPLQSGWRPDIAEFRAALGGALAALGDLAGAAAEYRAARALFEQLAVEDPALERERVQAGLQAVRAKLGR